MKGIRIMFQLPTTLRARIVGALSASVILLGIAAIAWHFAGQQHLLWRVSQIEIAHDEDVPLVLQALVAHGDAALPFLVEALSSKRPSVRQHAARIINGQIERWRLLDLSVSTPKFTRLLSLLKEITPNLDDNERKFAGDTAMLALQWPSTASSENRGQLIAECESILRQVALNRSQQVAIVSARDESRTYMNNQTTAEVDVGRSPLDRTSDLPGGGLAIEVAQLPRLSLDKPREVAEDKAVLSPEILPPPAVQNTPAEIYQPLAIPLNLAPPSKESHEVPKDAGSAADASEFNESLNQLPLDQLLHRLEQGYVEPAAAHDELARRGYSEREVKVALLTIHPDDSIRQKLVEALPRLAGINAGKWLALLAHDEKIEVRHAAISMLATSDHRDTTRWLHKMRAEAQDRRTAELIDQLLEGRE